MLRENVTASMSKIHVVSMAAGVRRVKKVLWAVMQSLVLLK